MFASYKGVFGAILFTAVALVLAYGSFSVAFAQTDETLPPVDPAPQGDVVTTDDVPQTTYGRIKVWKHVVGATEVDYSQFSFTVNGGTPFTFEADEDFVYINDLGEGTYTIEEVPVDGYTPTYAEASHGNLDAPTGDCTDIEVANGEISYCRITNTPAPIDDEQENTDTEGQCEFEGHKYDETGTPLMDWVIGLMKFVTYEVDGTNDSFILDEEATDADGYYCLETNGYDGTYGIEGSYSFIYKIYEILEDGWENVSVEMGTNEDVENNTLTIVLEGDIEESETDFVGDGERGVQKIITVDVSEENGYIFADAAFHVDFYNQETDGGNGGGETDEDTYKIFGYVWHDKNENDVWEKEGENLEEDLAGWTVKAVNGTDIRTTTTDENGRYEFNVPAGTWTITEELQNEWNQTLPNEGGHTVVVPAVPEIPAENVIGMIRSFLIPTAYAATISEHGAYDFGVIFKGCVTNCGSSNGGSSGGNGGRKGSKSSSSDTSDDPVPEVLGEATSVLPEGAPNTGFGGTSVSPIASLIALFGMIMSLGLLRRATHVK